MRLGRAAMWEGLGWKCVYAVAKYACRVACEYVLGRRQVGADPVEPIYATKPPRSKRNAVCAKRTRVSRMRRAPRCVTQCVLRVALALPK